MNFLIAAVIGYLLGSIPFGLLLTRAVGIDIRSVGSGNIGATNVLRTGNRWLAAGTLLLDAGKGIVAVLIARWFLISTPGAETLLADRYIVYAAGIGAFFGHVFPVWLGFKGGKGVATYIGVLLAWNWVVGLVFCGVWLLVAFGRKYSSLAALTAAATAPLFAYGLAGAEDAALSLAAACALLTLVLYYKHWGNIRRLWDGTEPKIGSEKNKAG
ncbi:MAG: glycerol-3-phosphate 1-O-acyltransferase PlsY [Devosia sp.]|uniref:glycerol-3-phosphate 1-O-acyltransferase PlsY n=1 Tax=Devosia sp. TaxID=1871048 RepID=UPI001ACD0920|nr:glycerol-3-phosphate 1-O-acyltransferase PlsY [Devosia sp.]MBN9314318.1 glycerol-3-phosphate 1-O-acyltransferase PlsY [Devosia sp.]